MTERTEIPIAPTEQLRQELKSLTDQLVQGLRSLSYNEVVLLESRINTLKRKLGEKA